MSLSIIILTKNEENTIVDSLESASFADEIIIVDDNSTDRIDEIIKKINNPKIKLTKHSLDHDFSAQRNFALKITKSDWILFLDADERISKELQKEIIEKIKDNNIDGYFIKRSDFLWGKKLRYGETGNIKLLRLGKRGSGIWKGKVHETWNIKGKTSELENDLTHLPHQTIKEFLSEINYYSDLRAKELFDKGVESNLLSIIIYTKGKFMVNYFLKLGFLDGIPGFVFAILMSFYSFMVRGKLYLLRH
ncbi:glycosyltransferase family 2 protein [Candidatus Parcubacteria bacterium]|nr:MAG: glycosyltransferase family 2 protein [Candidatus Parcubacteria bacterium]